MTTINSSTIRCFCKESFQTKHKIFQNQYKLNRFFSILLTNKEEINSFSPFLIHWRLIETKCPHQINYKFDVSTVLRSLNKLTIQLFSTVINTHSQ